MYANLTFHSSAKDRIPPAERSDFMCMFMDISAPETPAWAIAHRSTRRNLLYPRPHLSSHLSQWHGEGRVSPYHYILSALTEGTSCRQTTDRWEELKRAQAGRALRGTWSDSEKGDELTFKKCFEGTNKIPNNFPNWYQNVTRTGPLQRHMGCFLMTLLSAGRHDFSGAFKGVTNQCWPLFGKGLVRLSTKTTWSGLGKHFGFCWID